LRFAAYRSRPETTHSQVAHRFNTNNLARAVPEIGVETPKNLHELRINRRSRDFSPPRIYIRNWTE